MCPSLVCVGVWGSNVFRSNPFVTSAIASNAILERHRCYPRDRSRLDKLQKTIDAFTDEVEANLFSACPPFRLVD